MRRITLYLLPLIFAMALISCDNEPQAERESPEQVVERWLNAHAVNDYEAWVSTMTEEKRQGFTKENNGDHGVISMEIVSLESIGSQQNIDNFMDYEIAKEMKLKKENVALISANFIVEYDNTKVPTNSGDITWGFVLIRKDKNAPWLIWDWGYGGSWNTVK